MSHQQYTILIVDDSLEDRQFYLRYLQGDEQHNYRLVEAELGEEGLELWQQYSPDLILLDYCLPDLDGLEFMAQLQKQTGKSYLPVIVLTGQGNEAIAVKSIKAGAQDYLVKGQNTPEILRLVIYETLEKLQLRNQLQQHIDRERLFTRITRQIHQSLDLAEILNTTVNEVRQLLKTDRVLILRLQSDGWAKVKTESVGAGWISLSANSYYDSCLTEKCVEHFRQGVVSITPDVHNDSITPCHLQLMLQLQVKAKLALPITQGKHLWGMLMVHHCQAPRQWQPLEVDLLKELTTQLGIAIQQAELYQQAQNELRERQQVEEELKTVNKQLNQRIGELFTLNSITQTVATVIDLSTVLDTLTEQITHLFNAHETAISLLNENGTELRMTASYTISLNKGNLVERIVPVDQDYVATCLIQRRKVVIIPITDTNPSTEFPRQILAARQLHCLMSVGLQTKGKVIGTITVACQQGGRVFTKAEVQLAQTIASQIASAIENARLFSAVQEAKEVAEAASKAKSQFLANISHELRTSLNGVLGYAQILRRDKTVTPKQKKAIQTIYKCGNHLLMLINDILDLSKIEASKIELHPKTFNFTNFLTEVTEIFHLKAQQKKINFTCLTSTPLPEKVYADEKRLRQIVINLLSNAIKFTGAGGRVTLQLGVSENQDETDGTKLDKPRIYQQEKIKIRFQIEDTGIGIASEELSNIFLPFEQVGATSSHTEGTGLGLAITQKLVNLMGSQILVESTLGVGSRFWFDLELPSIYRPKDTNDQVKLSLPITANLEKIFMPSREELLLLHQAAASGNVEAVEREISRIKQLNPSYNNFVARLLELAEEFEYEEIVELISPCI